jgi:hypothetical protein
MKFDILSSMLLRFYANLRTAMGVDSQEVHDRNVDSFRKVLHFLLDQYPQAAFHLVDESGNLRPDVPVFVDGRNPRLLRDGIDAVLPPHCVVSFFSPISSGRINVEVLRGAPSSGKE